MNWFTVRLCNFRSWLNYCWLSFLGVQGQIDRLESQIEELESDVNRLEGLIDDKVEITDLDQVKMDKAEENEFVELRQRVDDLETTVNDLE